MRRHLVRLIVLLMLPIATGGCIRLGDNPAQPIRYFTLQPLSRPTDPAVSSRAEELTVGVGPVRLPAYLNRPQIMVRTGPNEYRIAEFARWAEPLEESLPRVLAENLSILLDSDRIVRYPWRRSNPPDLQLSMEVLRLDAGEDGEVRLVVHWRLLTKRDGEILVKQSSFSEPAPAEDFGALTGAVSRTVAALSREAAAAVSGVSGKSGE